MYTWDAIPDVTWRSSNRLRIRELSNRYYGLEYCGRILELAGETRILRDISKEIREDQE